MSIIDIHADDYGVSMNASLQILECIKQEKLDSISIIPNTDYFEESVRVLMETLVVLIKKPLISIHLNLIDGYSLAGKEAELLCDENGYCKISWGKLFLISCFPGKKRKQLKHDLKLEIKKQIERMIPYLPVKTGLRIDSHQHTHMIPVVAQALMEVIDEECYPVEFVRVAKEPLCVFLKKFSLYASYSPINIVKNVILNLCAVNLEKKLSERKIDYDLLWGLVMSGHMDVDRIQLLQDDMLEYVNRKNKNLEILFHPGQTLACEITPAACKAEINEFYLSENRNIERYAVLNLIRE